VVTVIFIVEAEPSRGVDEDHQRFPAPR